MTRRSPRASEPDSHSPTDEQVIRDHLSCEDPRRRREAALVLLDEGADDLAPETVDQLRKCVQEDPDADVRQFAVEALGVVGEGSDVIRIALDDPNEWVRSEAVVALTRVAPDDVEVLYGALEDENGWVRRNTVIALGKTGVAAPELLVDRIKNDPHPAVREYAAMYLGELADDVEEAVRLLAALLARDPEAFVRVKAAGALGELATDRAEEALERHGITDRSDDVQRTAKRALAAVRGIDPDQLDVDLDDAGPPGGGPQSPHETPGPGFNQATGQER